MKKFKNIVLMAIVISMVITGCTKEKVKTEAEIRAEVEAELKAEKEKKEALKEEIRAELKAEENQEKQKKQEEAQVADASTKEKSGLLVFEDVYDGTSLARPLEYFDNNFEQFEDETKKDFAEKFLTAYNLKRRQYHTNELEGLEADEVRMGPVPPLSLANYYSYYSMEDSTINLDLIEGKYDQIIKLIEEDDLLTLVAEFWASDGYIEGISFTGAIKYEYQSAFDKMLEVAGENSSESCLTWGKNDGPFNSDVVAGYPYVYIDEPAVLKQFENENCYKTTVVLPIKNVIGQVDLSAGKLEEVVIKPFDESMMTGFQDEVLDGMTVDFSEYSAVIVPMYNGKNKEKLEKYSTSFSGNGNKTVYFAAFGQLENVQLTYFENNDAEGEVINVGNLKNSFIEIKGNFPSEESYVRVSSDIIVKSGEESYIGFNLEVGRDVSEYGISTID